MPFSSASPLRCRNLARRLGLAFGLALALPAAAQVPAVKPVAAPKPVERINPQIRTPVTAPLTVVAPRADAQTIAAASPNLREAARSLKQAGQPAAASLAAVRSVFRAADRDNYQSLLAVGYARPDLFDAFKLLDKADAPALRTKLHELGEPSGEIALQLVRMYPGFTFDGLFALLSPITQQESAFRITAEAMALNADQAASTAARYHLSRLYRISEGHFFPEADTAASLVRERQPAIAQGQLWWQLLRVGYAPSEVFQHVPIGGFDRTGRAMDAVASCVIQHFPNRLTSGALPLEVAIALDGSASHNDGQVECYATLLRSLRTQAISRATAAQVLDAAVTCLPKEAATCEANRQPVIALVLERAGYSPAGR